MGGARGEDQKVIIQRLILGDDFLLIELEIDHFFKQHFNVGASSQDPTNGRRYFAGRQAGGCHLVEQRLEGVVVFPIDECDLNGKPSDAAGGGQACETGAHDHDPRSSLAAGWLWFRWHLL